MIFGQRIRLRALERTDIPRCTAWINDAEVIENLLIYVPMSLDMEEDWYEGLKKSHPAERPLAIEVNSSDGWVHIGNVGLHNIDWKSRLAELGILIGEKAYWNRGYGREAVRLMTDYGFREINLNKVFLQVYATNPRGIRAYEHAGFVVDGRLRQDIYKNGRYIDVLIMSVLRSEWEASQEKE